MAVKTTHFMREGTPFELFQIGENYKEPQVGIVTGNYSLDLIKITLILTESGIREDKIPELTQKIMKFFYPEG
jgi:hypothetical protein